MMKGGESELVRNFFTKLALLTLGALILAFLYESAEAGAGAVFLSGCIDVIIVIKNAVVSVFA